MKNESEPGFQELLEYLKRARGFDFKGYKSASLKRRIEHRMQAVAVNGFDAYLDYLQVHSEEFAFLFDTILINVTDFFRDREAWDYIRDHVIPSILEKKSDGEPIRVWSAGAAAGQEAYSAAMLLAELLGAEAFRSRVKIYATDADEGALTQARTATYSLKQVEAIPKPLLEKYFEPNADQFVFRSEFRRSIIFGRHNIIYDAPISRLDLLICRNTLMYFNAETQARIVSRLHFALNEGGYLFLGKAEMIMTRSNLFAPAKTAYRIFTKVSTGNTRERLLEMAHPSEFEDFPPPGRRLREAAIDFAPTPQLVVDVNGTVVLANERARSVFGLTREDIGRPLRDLEISYRPVELRSLIEQAHADRRPVALRGIERSLENGETQYLDLQVAPLPYEGDSILGTMITFIDVSQGQRMQTDLKLSSEALATAVDELQSANEELETSNEELQSANEELETTNEELQSANEELETMNEELQSSNEELNAVNQSLRERTEEYQHLQNWLQSVLSISPAALIVIDRHFNVILWNQNAQEMWGLRADEVIDSSFFDLDIGLPVNELRASIRAGLLGQTNVPLMMVDAVNRRGRAFKCEILITPFGEAPDQRSGVALTMQDVTERE